MDNGAKQVPRPDGFTSDGVPVYIICARGSSKSMFQLEIYRRLCGISDEEWIGMKRLVYLENEEGE